MENMDIKSKAWWLYVHGYDYGVVISCANDHNCSLQEAIEELFNEEFLEER